MFVDVMCSMHMGMRVHEILWKNQEEQEVHYSPIVLTFSYIVGEQPTSPATTDIMTPGTHTRRPDTLQ